MVDWRKTTTAQRKALFAAVEAAAYQDGLDWRRLLRRLLPRHAYADSYLYGLRAGRMSGVVTLALAGWLKEVHPDAASRLEASLRAVEPPGAPWDTFLRADAEDRGLSIVTPASGLVTFADAEPTAPRPVRLGAKFWFSLDSAIAGHALALQSVRGMWFALPLAREGISAPVVQGVQALPAAPGSGAPVPLSEDIEAGRHRFAVLVTAQVQDAALTPGIPVEDAILDRLAATTLAMPRDTWRLYRIAVVFCA